MTEAVAAMHEQLLRFSVPEPFIPEHGNDNKFTLILGMSGYGEPDWLKPQNDRAAEVTQDANTGGNLTAPAPT